MWHLGIGFRGDFGNAGLMAGINNLAGCFKP